MIRIILILVAVVIMLLALRWLKQQPANRQWQIAMIMICVILLGLVATGRMHWLYALIGAILPVARRLFGLLAYLPMLRRTINTFRGQQNPGADQQSRNSTKTSAALTVSEAYAILNLEPGASREDITQAHKQLMQKMHPDRGGSSHLATKINQARDVLLDATEN